MGTMRRCGLRAGSLVGSVLIGRATNHDAAASKLEAGLGESRFLDETGGFHAVTVLSLELVVHLTLRREPKEHADFARERVVARNLIGSELSSLQTSANDEFDRVLVGRILWGGSGPGRHHRHRNQRHHNDSREAAPRKMA